MTDTPPDWVLIEAAKRCGWLELYPISILQSFYGDNRLYSALCDMILKHEQRPVDRKLLCADEVHRLWCDTEITELRTFAIRAIELWEEGFGK